MGTIVLIVVSTFVFTVWPLKKVATWLGAEKDSYGAVIFALFLSFVLCILAAILSIPLAFLGVPGFIVIGIIFLFAIGTAYSKALGTPFWNGVGIAVFAGIFGATLQLLFALIFGVTMFPEQYEGEVSIAVIEEAGEDVCRCGTDQACMKEKMELFGQMMQADDVQSFSEKDNASLQKITTRAFTCMMKPSAYKAPKKKKKRKKKIVEETYSTDSAGSSETVDSSATVTIPPPVEVAPPPTVKKIVYAWRQASLDEFPNLLGKNIKILTTSDLERNGVLESYSGGDAIVKKSKSISYTVPRSKIKSVQVYDEAR
jgi:hypothetical protein